MRLGADHRDARGLLRGLDGVGDVHDEGYAANLSMRAPDRATGGKRGNRVAPFVSAAYRRLQRATQDLPPLEALDPFEYAIGHALFESRSDQRAHLAAWLADHLAVRAAAPSRVLSIGCGDGSVDVLIAAVLAGRDQPVDYVGVEPHAPSGHAFLARLGDVTGTGVSVLMQQFDLARPRGRYDVVLAVHSLYYVPDLAATLRRACSMLAPDGELILVHAPLEPLNTLVRLLAPGHRQAFGDEVTTQLRALGRSPEIVRVDNRLDLTATGDAETDHSLVAFAVQGRVPPTLLPLVRDALTERALPEPGLVLSHPFDTFVIRT